eukprot:scaffold6140_cov114-Isochrysis_galbana.AAC.4
MAHIRPLFRKAARRISHCGECEWRACGGDSAEHICPKSSVRSLPLSTHPIVRTEVVHTVQSPPLQAGSCHVCRSMKGEGDRGLGEIGESEC